MDAGEWDEISEIGMSTILAIFEIFEILAMGMGMGMERRFPWRRYRRN
jgi:hypothetical protein